MKNILVESTKSKFKTLPNKPANVLKRIQGILSDFKSNRNGRIYPRELWENVLNSDYVKEMIENHGLVGELDHPEERLEISLQNVSHVINDMWIDGDQVMGIIDILPTPSGKIVNELLDYGTDIGISSRGAGSVGSGNIVDPDYQFVTFDFVARPSCEAARLNTILESVQPEIETNSDDKVNAILESYKGSLNESEDTFNAMVSELHSYVESNPKNISIDLKKAIKDNKLDDYLKSKAAMSDEEISEFKSKYKLNEEVEDIYVRQYTNKLIDALESGVLSWETVCHGLLNYLSEEQVKDFCRMYDYDTVLDDSIESLEESDDYEVICKIYTTTEVRPGVFKSELYDTVDDTERAEDIVAELHAKGVNASYTTEFPGQENPDYDKNADETNWAAEEEADAIERLENRYGRIDESDDTEWNTEINVNGELNYKNSLTIKQVGELLEFAEGLKPLPKDFFGDEEDGIPFGDDELFDDSVQYSCINRLNESDEFDEAWSELTGSDQTAVEYFLSNFANQAVDEDDLRSKVRQACWTIGEANEELIDSDYWTEEEYGSVEDSEPNEDSVYNFLVKFNNDKLYNNGLKEQEVKIELNNLTDEMKADFPNAAYCIINTDVKTGGGQYMVNFFDKDGKELGLSFYSYKLEEAAMSDQDVFKTVLKWYKNNIENGNMTLNQCYELLSDKAKVSLNKMVDQSKIKESIMNKTIDKLLKESKKYQ